MNKNDTKIKKMVKIVLFSVKQENFSQIKGTQWEYVVN